MLDHLGIVSRLKFTLECDKIKVVLIHGKDILGATVYSLRCQPLVKVAVELALIRFFKACYLETIIAEKIALIGNFRENDDGIIGVV